MKEMNRNEHFIRNMLLLIEQMTEQNLEEEIKKYVDELEFGDVEQNSLYVKCIFALKQISHLTGEKYKEKAQRICQDYLSYEIDNPIKYQSNFRKEKYKQLNLDIPKDVMERFDQCLERTGHTKKSVILKAIEDYIHENETKKTS
ncbi:MAG: hypothetical protein PUB18_01390 [bacterium]|nr:hypothetical protein [bacterium]